MIKQYIISYKTLGMPYWYQFMTYADCAGKAIATFIKAEPIGIEAYKIIAVLDI